MGTIKVQNILARKPFAFSERSLGETLELSAAEDMDVSIVLREPGWTLYEFDFEKACAIFLFGSPDVDLFRAPFVYTAQARSGQRYATLPFQDFLALSQTLKPKHRIVQFFNIGHCGSTLLHHVFNASGEAWDISEPRFCFDLAWNRARLGEDEKVALARAGLAFLSLYPSAESRDTLIVKHFSQSSKILDVWRTAAPDAHNIFMYRDALSWCNSVFGFAQRMGMPVPMPPDARQFIWSIQSANEPLAFLDGVLDINREDIRFEELSACSWCLHMQEFEAARRAGMTFHAFRYNELVEDRAKVLAEVFGYCGFRTDRMSDALQAFDHDSHEGEQTSHEQPVQKLTEKANQCVVDVLMHPRFAHDPDMIIA